MELKRTDEHSVEGAIEMPLRAPKLAVEPQRMRTLQPYRIDKKPRLFLVKPGTLAEHAQRREVNRERPSPAVTQSAVGRKPNLFVIPKPRRKSADSYQWMMTIAWLAPGVWLGHGVCRWLKLI